MGSQEQEVWRCQKDGPEVAHKWEMMGFFNVMKFVFHGSPEGPPLPGELVGNVCWGGGGKGTTSL